MTSKVEMQEYQSGLNVASINIRHWLNIWGFEKTKALVKREIRKHSEKCQYNEGIVGYYHDFIDRPPFI